MFKTFTSFVLTSFLITEAWSLDNLQSALDTLETRVQGRLSSNQNKNAIVVIGPSRGGKSTLINVLAGESLDAVLGIGGNFVLRRHDGGNLNPEVIIGHGAAVGTLNPGSHYLALPRDTTLWDCPGFGDARGPDTDIINAASIHRVLSTVENVKILMVVPQNIALFGGTGIPELFNQVAGIFPQKVQLEKMVSLVITKKQGAKTHMLDSYERDPTNTLTPSGRGLIRHLLSNSEERIGYLSEASNPGSYAFNHPDLWSMIDGKTEFVSRPDVTIKLANGSLGYLGGLSSRLNQDICRELMENRRYLIDAFKNSLNGSSLGTVSGIIKIKKDSLEHIQTVPPRKDDCIRVFSSIDLLPIKARDSIACKLEQIHTVDNICADRTIVRFEVNSWFGALQETLEMFDCIGELTVKTLELDEEIQRNVDAMRIKDIAIQQANDARHKAEMDKQAAQQKLTSDIQLLTTQHSFAISVAQKTAATISVPRLMGPAIPEVAKGYEEIYRRFLNGILIYNKGNSDEVMRLPIAALSNPLEGTFDLSKCGDIGQYLSISTGYRKGKNLENSSKVEIWFSPRFLIEKQLKTTAWQFNKIIGSWSESKAPVGIFWTWGGWDDLTWYNFLITESIDVLGSENLWIKYKNSPNPLDEYYVWASQHAKEWPTRGAHALHIMFMN